MEYQRGLGMSLCFQEFDRELAELPGEYVPPRGALLLARHGEALAGCVAMRPLGRADAEIKRLYVRPPYRGSGLGHALVEDIIERARRQGYARLKLDTLPTMDSAQRLYERMGFADTARYNENPVDRVRFMALELGPGAEDRAPV